jgi:aminoglycoside phosphotransferase family enzyme/predicted kinase
MTIPASQQKVADFLTGLAGQPPVETHISAVFVGAETVWKLKKAVRLPFVDFSSVDARHRFLDRELALNTPNAPGIYRDVVPIGRLRDGSLTIGQGEPIDWVLRMTKVPAADFLDAIAGRGDLTPSLLDRLGDCIADAHARLAPVSDWDSAQQMVVIAEGNAKSALAAGLPAGSIERWLRDCRATIDAIRPWLNSRAASGAVRRCHGDLHLGNLCLWQGTPVAFDALEFNEGLATIDTAYDLAFLLMDLDQHVGARSLEVDVRQGGELKRESPSQTNKLEQDGVNLIPSCSNRQAANRVMNRYVALTGDCGLVTGLPLFLSQRAMIRAHVKAATDQQQEGLRLLQAAQAYLQPQKPIVLAIGGLQGTGKSTLARALAPEMGRAPGALVVRSDETRKRIFDCRFDERLHAGGYGHPANETVNRQVIDTVCQAAAGGHSVIADSTFLDPVMRQDLRRRLDLIGIWLHAPLPVLEARVAQRQGDASDATVAVLRRSAERHTVPDGWHRVDATDHDRALASIRALIKPLA